MTRIKICGITNVEDAVASIDLGADILGFNFYPKSPRFISLDAASRISKRLSSEVEKIGVFVNAGVDEIQEAVDRVGLSGVQLHGEESPEFVSSVRDATSRFVIKAFRVSDTFLPETATTYDSDAILLDGFSSKQHGGTGETFDWSIAAEVAAKEIKLFLAGGLSGENVRAAIRDVRPYAVDACSLLESRPGMKDHERLRRFIFEVKRND